MTFLGQEVAVPDPPEALLEENYGGEWRTPDRHCHCVVSSRMPVNPTAPLFRYYVFSALVSALLHGEAERLRAVARCVREHGLRSAPVERAAAFGAS